MPSFPSRQRSIPVLSTHRSPNTLEKRVEIMIKIRRNRGENADSIVASDFAELPNSLQKTILAISKLKDANANQVAEETDRTREIESLYLNQLYHMGYVDKVRRGRRTYFKALRII